MYSPAKRLETVKAGFVASFRFSCSETVASVSKMENTKKNMVTASSMARSATPIRE